MMPPRTVEALPLISPVSSTAPTSNGDRSKRSYGSIHQFSRRISDLVRAHTGSIGNLGSISIAVNSLTGPAMLNLPATFERSGIIPTTATLVFVCILSALCCLHMANTISKVPDNSNYKKEVEFSEAFRFFWGKEWFIITQILFFCCITCLNTSSIVDTAQVVDTFLGHWVHGGSHALEIQDNGTTGWISWDARKCSKLEIKMGECLPYASSTGTLFTAGNLIVTLMFLPLALLDLKDNAIVQVVGFIILLVTALQFIIQFSLSPQLSFENASWWGYDWGDLFGVVVFNFALVIVIPAWLYEREPHVDVPTVIYGSSVLSLVLYVLIGVLGDMAMPHVSENMLESMMSGSMGTFMQLGASIFAFAIIGLGIPLFSVLTRLNLTGSGLCSRRVGNLLAVYLPFTASWFLYDGKTVTKLLSWGGIIFTGMVVFILPLVLATHVVHKFDYEGSVQVYFGWFQSKRAQLILLVVLLILTFGSLTSAIVGNLIATDED